MEGLPQPPPMVSQYEQQAQDAENIKLLVIFHYVMAGLVALTACFPIIYVVMGVAIVSGGIPMPPSSSGASAPDMKIMGWMFIGMGSLFTLLGWAMAVLTFLAGKWMSARQNWTFVFVMACIQCISVPLGTVLGVFTIIVLQRPSVKALFENGEGLGHSPYLNR